LKTTVVVGALVMGAVGTVIAAGAPQSAPLVYSGTLQDSVGAPLTGSQNLTLRLFSQASGGIEACVTPQQSVTPDALGRFSLSLSTACVDEVRRQADLFVELQINATVMPRVKLNAVPYALEADRALAAGRLVRASAPLPDGGVTRALSLNGTFCGATNNRNGNQGGYRGVKQLCETTCGRPTAHLCSTQEVVASYSVGLDVPTGWLSGMYTALGTPTIGFDDCIGYTSSATTSISPFWDTTAGATRVSGAFCNEVARPFLCCD
jgi:hypothetical protein